MAERILTLRELNRALLARQLLLQRTRLSVPRAIERVGALQGQWSPAPYVALWTRLEGFQIAQLERALAAKRVVKATLMRATLHLVSSADYPVYAAALVDARPAYSFMHAGRVHLPPSGTYSFHRGASFVAFEEWVGAAPKVPREPMRHLLRRYLAAFGPATIDDVASWMGVPTPAIRAVLDEAPRTFRDEAGRLLYDVPKAPLPPKTRLHQFGCSPSGTRHCSPTPRPSARASSPSAIARASSARTGTSRRRSSSTAS